MKQLATAFVAVTAVLVISACSPVKVKPAAEDVELLDAARVKNCERLGKTRVSVATKIGFIPRGDKAIHEDLRRLARNSSVEMGGDTIAEESEVRDGEQVFGVFKCIED